jgi:hypothetical protein
MLRLKSLLFEGSYYLGSSKEEEQYEEPSFTEGDLNEFLREKDIKTRPLNVIKRVIRLCCTNNIQGSYNIVNSFSGAIRKELSDYIKQLRYEAPRKIDIWRANLEEEFSEIEQRTSDKALKWDLNRIIEKTKQAREISSAIYWVYRNKNKKAITVYIGDEYLGEVVASVKVVDDSNEKLADEQKIFSREQTKEIAEYVFSEFEKYKDLVRRNKI